MSVEYYLVCDKHKEKAWACSDGLSGPQNQATSRTAGFIITHRKCSIKIIDEHCESCEDYTDWDDRADWKPLLRYDYEE